jgi:hypothetical protein
MLKEESEVHQTRSLLFRALEAKENNWVKSYIFVHLYAYIYAS